MYKHALAVGLLLVILIYLVNRASDEELSGPDSLADDTQAGFDFMMTGVDSIHFGVDGEPEYHIRARRLTHYPDPEVILVEAPDIVIYQSHAPPWFVSAEQGRISRNPDSRGDEVELSHNVVIRHTDARGDYIVILTEAVIIHPDSRQLETSAPVTVESEHYHQESLGMTADLNRNIIRFTANVEGRYE